jgi:predicted type IV restriction endonuclease
MPTPREVLSLVARFQENRDAYHSGAYNEEQLRKEFLDPFFKALGWDVDNTDGAAEAYKPVVHEGTLRTLRTTEAPDYTFRIGGVRKFFVEAKKPSVDVKEDTHPAYQLRRYAWSAKLPLSILTDFEEFAVYDCTKKPNQKDTAATGRILYFTYDAYPERWDEIAGLFSPNAITKGAFDRFAESAKRKKGTATVDDAFLKEIEAWRDTLAHNLALRNTGLSQRELNVAVQTTIDRIIFLRICEDRGIEEYGVLRGLLNGERVYPRLVELFRRADERYNSGLFHFKEEKGRPGQPDTLTLDLEVDDKVLKEILHSLYYPESPYEFSVLSADILGHVYEQFLGKVIRLTPGHHAVVEEKPEVKKAGGVYYTPTYIVDYIVKNTVGKLLDGKTPKETAALRVLDPACGSGSFLLGAYQELLDWHETWYAENDAARWAKGRSPRLYRTPKGKWRLTIAEKKRILLDHIFGVDIDPQAVEVTKLSLLLKVLEGENAEVLESQLRLFRERALPDLGRNIQCGNSLIGTDFYDDHPLESLSEEERYRINAFNWETAFPEIMQKGGFDVVIGNPPYVFGRDWKALGISDAAKTYLGHVYRTSPYQLDMFSIFMERALGLCCSEGRVGQIVPDVWLTNTYSGSTRTLILSAGDDLCLARPPKETFQQLTVDTVIFTLRKNKPFGKRFRVLSIKEGATQDIGEYEVQRYLDGSVPISTSAAPRHVALVRCLVERHPPLRQFAAVTRGVHSYRLGGYGRTAFASGPQTERDVRERPYHSSEALPGFRPFVRGSDLRRFGMLKPAEYVQYGSWLAEPREPRFFEGSRVYSRKILGPRLVVTVETGTSVADQQVYITLPTSEGVDARYIAGILGSRLIAGVTPFQWTV